jgi:DNA-binding XRE family transcriptional regulator
MTAGLSLRQSVLGGSLSIVDSDGALDCRTKTVRELHFIGPSDKIEELREMARSLGLKQVSESIPWREAFPEFVGESEPAVALRGARGKEGLTQKELSERSGIPQSHISDMENGKRAIGKQRARRLAKALNVSYRIFL